MENNGSDFMQGFYRGRAEGEIVEQERIIKLLENQDSISAEWAIAIIKGKISE